MWLTIMNLPPHIESILLQYAHSIEDDDLRGDFFKWCEDLLRPAEHRGIEAGDIHRAAAEAQRRLGVDQLTLRRKPSTQSGGGRRAFR
jgi:hypothetical protein